MEINKTEAIKEKASYFRATKSTGGENAIDPKGGKWGAGVIRGVSVITQGEALGHGMWIDSEFNEQVARAINMPNNGIKSRFTHPGLSGDGMGRHLGRIMDARVEGNQVIADQHFTLSSHSTPDGDLASYLMDLAGEDPEAYGLSIVFGHDMESQEEFELDNSGKEGFLSPDPKNLDNLPHARLGELRAADAVDEPAANPNGLFHREQEIAQDANAVASYALGLSNESPAVACLGIDADRVKRFVADYLGQNNLEIVEKGLSMSEEIQEQVEETTPEVVGESSQASSPELSSGTNRSGSDYLEAFGDQGGVWYAEGKSFEMCLALQNKALSSEVDSLRSQKSAPSETGETEAIEFSAEQDKQKRKGFASKIRIK